VGFAVGLKLTVAIYPVTIGLSLYWLAKNFIDYLRLAVIFSVSACIGLAASLGYWMTTLWKTFGNPFFPYFNKLFQSSYYQSINYTDNRFLPDNIYQTLFYPFYLLKYQNLTSEIMFREARFAICYLFFILFLIYILYKKIKKEAVFKEDKTLLPFNLFITSFFFLSYILWQYIYSIQRYIVVLEFVSPILLLFFLNSFQLKKQVSTYIFITLSIAIVFYAIPIDYGRMKWEDSYFGVQVPEIENLGKANVLMQGGEPLAYIVPYFPVKTRFIRLILKEPSLLENKRRTRYDDEVDAIVRKSNSNYILICNNDKSEVAEIEHFYNLKMDSSSCKKIISKLNDDLCVCKLISQP
ncbi:MAG TPA: hypothetical protein VNW06_04870, partial [Cytophagaceae bacterium]|nr:hypothetical protein [Cytophagaceae bacterium]